MQFINLFNLVVSNYCHRVGTVVGANHTRDTAAVGPPPVALPTPAVEGPAAVMATILE